MYGIWDCANGGRGVLNKRITVEKTVALEGKEPMKPVINLLIQIQELTEARAQQETMMPNARFEQLDSAIKSLMAQAPAPLRLRFQKLQKKGPLAIVPVYNGICSGCGMALPVSLVHTVKAAEAIHGCPNCTRLLYVPSESKPKRITQTKKK